MLASMLTTLMSSWRVLDEHHFSQRLLLPLDAFDLLKNGLELSRLLHAFEFDLEMERRRLNARSELVLEVDLLAELLL